MSRAAAEDRGYVCWRDGAVELGPNAAICAIGEPETGSVLLVVESGGNTSTHLAEAQLRGADGAPVPMEGYSGALSVEAQDDVGFHSKVYTVRDSQTGTLYAVGVAGGSNDTSATIAPIAE